MRSAGSEPTQWDRCRQRRVASRGTAAVEFALVMPVFLAVIGMSIVIGLGSMARFQMMGLAHEASRMCIIDPAFDRTSVGGCIGAKVNQLASQPYAFVRVCQLSGAQVYGPDLISDSSAPAPVYQLRTTLQCSYSVGLSLLGLIPGNPVPPAITLGVTSTTPYLPRFVP